MRRRLSALFAAGCLLMLGAGCSNADTPEWNAMTVAVSAYNSVASQTTRHHPALAAWGARLKPGMRAIAVSRDLIRKGLTRGTKVKIPGLPGVYTVRDKMAPRWHNKIDVYMGRNVARARAWGVRHHVRILYAAND